MDTRHKPTLVGERVLLRPFGPADAAAMHASTLDEESMRLTGTRRTFTPEEIRAWCEKIATAEGRVDLAVVAKDGGEFLGEVVLNEIDEENLDANFRIALAAERYFGRGYGTEAARLMVRYGFEALGLHRIELEVFAFNPRAVRVYEKLGFRHEGRKRRAHFQDGAWHDVLLMGLLRDEFAADRP